MKARAAVTAERRGAATRCTVLRSQPPLTFRETPERLLLVGTAAGPVGGDDLGLELAVGPAAALSVGSVAASLVLPGRHGARSSMSLRASVAAGGSLVWAPEPIVLVRGADHESTTTLTLDGGARLLWREEVVLGRHHEPSGSLLQRLRVDVRGRAVVRNDLAVGPRWPGSLGPAGTAGARVVATVVAIGFPLDRPEDPNVDLTVHEMGPATVLLALAGEAGHVRRALDRACGGNAEAWCSASSSPPAS